jgi:hypothetical protein
LRQKESAHHGDTEWPTQLGPGSTTNGQGKRPEKRRHSSHQDGAKAQKAGLADSGGCGGAACAPRFDGEVDQDDGVLLHDADKQNDTDERDDAELGLERE